MIFTDSHIGGTIRHLWPRLKVRVSRNRLAALAAFTELSAPPVKDDQQPARSA
jgi:hypothetical protein